MGLGILLINETSEIVHQQGYRVMAKFSSTPIYLSMKKQAAWRLRKIERVTQRNVLFHGGSGKRGYKINMSKGEFAGFRVDVKTYSFEYIPVADREPTNETRSV